MIEKLKDEKNAIILAHNYSRPEIQDVADFVGDSLELAEKASKMDADIIVFCGVDFMAETAAILNPGKKVLIPDIAICPMAQMLKTEDLLKSKKRYPDAEVVLYINTLAEHKVYADCICTSANAADIVEPMNSDTVIFGPDINLARYVESQTSKRVIPVPEYGLCPTHHQITAEDLSDAKARHPGVEIVAHPECTENILKRANAIASTSGMIKYCKESEENEFLIATEIGLIHRLRKDVPGKKFYPLSKSAVCPQMKTHTLRKVERALEVERIHVKVPKDIAEKAMIPIERMLSMRC